MYKIFTNYFGRRSRYAEKILLTMKVFVVMILMTIFQAKAITTFAQKINLNEKNATLTSVIKKIRQQSGYDFVYNVSLVEDINNVQVTLVNGTVVKALEQSLKNTNLTYSIDNKVILIKRKTTANPTIDVQADTLIIGRVIEASTKKPMPGVTIFVSNKKGTVQTDEKGVFKLLADKESVLTFSYVGYKSKDVAVKSAGAGLVVSLEESINEMKDVVVTGIFNKPRESYTGAVTTITQEQILTNRGQNLLQTLKNIDPALQIRVDNALGSNPNNIPDVTLRGRSSLPLSVEEFNSGTSTALNTPLVIVDGFEVSLTRLMDYNDDDIETINILKDAAATAIYGSRGANGVIVVVRKRPKAGKLSITPRMEYTFEMPDLNSYDLLDAGQLLSLQNQLGHYYNAEPEQYSAIQNVYKTRLTDVLQGVNTDWLHYPVRTGLSSRYGMRLEGGSDQFIWGTNLNYNSTQGAMKGSERNTFNGDITLGYSYKNILIRNQFSLGLNKASESPYGAFTAYANAMPYYKPYDNNGSLLQYFPGFFANNPASSIANPLYDASLDPINDSRYTELINNFSIDWKFNTALRLNARFGISKRATTSDRFLPADHSTFRTYTTDELYFRRGRYTYNTGDGNNLDGQMTLNYTKTLGEKHQVYAGLDYSMRQNKSYNYGFVMEGFPAESKGFLGNALQYAESGRPSSSQATTRQQGFTGNLNYTYDNRYFADFSYRLDGSSQFGSENRFAPFWSAGLGWNLHQEDFLKDSKVISSLRLRGSYGESGSQQFSAFQAQQMYQYYTDDKYMNRSGVYLLALGNDNLKWQVTDQLNGGMEINILDSRFTAAIDLYMKKTSNLLSARDIVRSSGFVSFIDNVGEVKNTGFEASVNALIIRNDRNTGLSWNLGARIANNRNRITKLSDAIKVQNEAYRLQNRDISSLFYEGYDQNSLWVVKSLGIDPSTGQELYLDADGNVTQTWNASAKVFAGIANPKYNGNLTSMLRYKNFSLNLNFSYRWGGKVYNQTLISKVEVATNVVRDQNLDARVFDARWMQPGDKTFFKAFSENATRGTTRFVMDDNVLELQSASLEYRIANSALLKRYSIQNIRIAANMSDLLYISSVQRERGTDYPYARRAGLSLSLQF